MTAIIGYCLSDGAYLAADSRRTEIDTGKQWSVKKIENLKEGMVIATGGLGTFGDNAKKRLIDSMTKEMLLEEIIENAKKIFSSEFSNSFVKVPGHNESLTCIIAGIDDHGKGFICALPSKSNFDPYWIRNVGTPYFTGSKTKLVQCIASDVIRELKETDEKLKFDKWATESIKKIRRIDQNVGFPLQIVCAKQDVQGMHTINECDYKYRHEFATEFPPL